MKETWLLCVALSLGCSYSVVVGETPELATNADDADAGASTAGACLPSDWTNGSLCEPRFSTLCDLSQLIVVEDSSAQENASARELARVLAASCPSSPGVSMTDQADATVFEANSGRPISGPEVLLILVGGPERQVGLSFLQQHAAAMVGKVDGTGYYLTSPEGGAAGGLNPVSGDRDLAAIQTLREPASKSVVLSIFGQREAGSVAGVHAFITDLPALIASPTWWFTLSWRDSNGDLAPDPGDQFLTGTRSGT
jgi:hypothetical protein